MHDATATPRHQRDVATYVLAVETEEFVLAQRGTGKASKGFDYATSR